MTIEERKQRILDISREIVRHEMSIESLKSEMDEHFALMDGRKRRALKGKSNRVRDEEDEEAETYVHANPSDQPPLNV